MLALQDVPETLLGAAQATGPEGTAQEVACGPTVSQIAIGQLDTNGGGFFGVDSAHSFVNPTIGSDMVQTLSILPITVAFMFLFRRMVGDQRQGWALFAVMGVLFVAGLAVSHAHDTMGTPLLGPGENMEGKEARFGAVVSAR